MKTSIIIPSYGRPSVLDECLKSIKKLSKKDFDMIKPYEIIIVNNNNEKIRKETSKVCRKYKKLHIKELKSKPLGSIGARNTGIKKSSGKIIIMFDDDTIIQKNYFVHLMKHYKNKKVGGVGGSEIKTGQQDIFHKLFFLFNKTGNVSWCGEITSNFSPEFKKPMRVKHLHGSNFSIRKKVIEEIGLMDKKMTGHYRDDTEFTYRVYKAGYELVFEPKAKVVHTATGIGGNVSPDEKRKWAYWYHRNTSYFFFKHLYNNNLLKLTCYLIREFAASILRSIIYNNFYYATEMKAILEGWSLNLKP